MDNKELEKIYNDTYRSVYWTAMSLLKDEDDAQDIVQETFVTLIDSYDTLKDRNKVAAWLKKIAANKCLDRLRRTKTVNAEADFFENVEAQPEDFLPDSILESAEKRKIIMDIIDNVLSDDIRRTLVLFYYDEMTTKEIASLLGIPQGTVLWRLNFAKKKIKKEVEKYEEDNNDKLYAMAAVPFLTKLFAKEAEQVPLKPIAASLLSLSASADVPAKAATAKVAASSAAKGGAGLALNKVIIAVVALALAGVAAVVVLPKIIEEPEETTVETTATQTEETQDAVIDATSDGTSATDTAADLSADLIGTWMTDLDGIDEYLLLNDDGTYVCWHVNADGLAVDSTSGTYTVDGDVITRTSSDGIVSDMDIHSIDGDTLTIEDPDHPGEPMIYTRQEGVTEDMFATAAPVDTSSTLIGTWSVNDGNNVLYLSFNEDGTLDMWQVNAVGQELHRETYTYTVESNEMFTLVSNGSDTAQVIYTVDGDTLTLANPEDPNETYVLTRSGGPASVTYTASDLAGTWVSMSSGAHIWMTFHEDGTLDVWAVDANGAEMDRSTGTFTIEGNVLSFYSADGSETNAYVITIDGDTLAMADTDDPEFIIGYSRQA